MRKLIAIACVLAVTPAFAGDAFMFENARVVQTAFGEWKKTFETKVTLSNDYMSMRPVDPTRLSNVLETSGIDRVRVQTLVDNLYERNANVEKFAAPPHRNGDTHVRTFRATLPAYDDARKHALVLGTPGDGAIYLALLDKVSEEKWRVTWRGRMELEKNEGPFRVGGNVKAPVVVRRVEPIYTQLAIKARIAGVVILETTVNKQAQVTEVRVLKPLPFGLDQAAIDAVKQWEFKPGTFHGEPVDVIFNLTINFRPPD